MPYYVWLQIAYSVCWILFSVLYHGLTELCKCDIALSIPHFMEVEMEAL